MEKQANEMEKLKEEEEYRRNGVEIVSAAEPEPEFGLPKQSYCNP